jgi:hypothetical protein
MEFSLVMAIVNLNGVNAAAGFAADDDDEKQRKQQKTFARALR